MMIALWGVTILAALAVFESTANVDETPAEPRQRNIPDYPASCMPPPGETAKIAEVTVSFGVNEDGLTEDVRVVESTDPCFEEAAVAAVRSWIYTPRRIKGRDLPQEDLETTFTFQFDEDTSAQDFDARPFIRVPPRYPDSCQRDARSSETVVVEFDVTAGGETENIRVVESTNKCFNRSAIASVSKWRYHPKTLSGKPVPRKSIQTAISFELGFRASPASEVRRDVRRRLIRAQQRLRRGADPDEILADLEQIEAEYGDTFSNAELAAFHHIRGLARLLAKDYRGALDDLRFVDRSGMAGDAREAVAETIEQLEAYLAAEEAGAAPEEGEDQN